MRVNNINDDVILRYSRTFQAINADRAGRFDAVLADESRRAVNTGRDTLIASAAQRYSSSGTSGRDTLIAAKAQEVSQSGQWNNYGRFDPVFRPRKRNGDVSCV